MENLNEKEEMQGLFYNWSCDCIVSFFKAKSNEKMKPDALMLLILEQISKSYFLETSSTNPILDSFREYLQYKIGELKFVRKECIKGNSLDDCIEYLEMIIKDALENQKKELGEQIKERLEYFIQELKKRYNQ